jgi:hypothetical protein
VESPSARAGRDALPDRCQREARSARGWLWAEVVRLAPSSLVILLAGACDVGSVSSLPAGLPAEGAPDASPSPSADPPDFALAVAPATATTSLGTVVHVAITVTGVRGMRGPIELAATGVPASWQAVITPAAIALDPGDARGATADLALTIPTDAADLSATPGVRASGGGATHAQAAPLTVAPEVVVTIADGTGKGDHRLPARIDIRLGTKLRIVDADGAAPHRIHSDQAASTGFGHQADDMTAGQEYDVTPQIGGGMSYRWYCHDHGVGTGVVQLVVK